MPQMPAARLGDNIIQMPPHCHAPIHPAAPVPTPVAHPPVPWAINPGTCAATVKHMGKKAAIMGTISQPCSLPSCVPNGPGVIMKCSMTVLIENRPAARINDVSVHAGCVAPIPGPTGKVTGAGAPTVQIGG